LKGLYGEDFDLDSRASFLNKPSEYFGWASSRSDDEPSGRYALHYKSSYEQTFATRIFVKRGLTVQ
jgi:hypothetical protein